MPNKPPESGPVETTNYADEVSLRDLYLILRKGFVWIALSVVVAGAAVFGYLTLQPATFSAESTTLMTPLVGAPSFTFGDGDSISVAEGGTVRYATYETLAYSRQVLEAVNNAVPEYEGGIRGLERTLDLQQLIGPAGTADSGPLAVTHAVSHASAELAAELANVWAEETVEVVRASLLDDMRPVREATVEAVSNTQAELEEIERQLRDFNATNETSLLQGYLSAASSDLIALEQSLRSLRNTVSREETELEVVTGQIQQELSSITTTDPTSTTFLAGMTLLDATEFVFGQLDVARNNRLAASEALREFDRNVNISLLQALESELESRIAGDTWNLMTIDRSLEIQQASLQAELAELGRQPERLTLFRSLLSNDLMVESWRNQQSAAGELADLAELTVYVEQFNPLHSNLLQSTLNTRLQIAELEDRRDIVTASLEDYQAELAAVKDERLTAQEQRQHLEIAAAEAGRSYDAIAADSVPLRLASQRPDAGSLELRAGGGIVEGLRRQQRELELSLATLQSRIASAEADSAALRQEIEQYRLTIADLNMQQSLLTREADQRRAAYGTVVGMRPLMEYFGELAPGNARIMNLAAVPEEADGGRTLPSLIAAVVAGLLVTVFLFLREAVRDPNEGSPATTKPTAVAATD